MAADLDARYGIETELIGGGGGVFDVRVDGQLVYSKFDTYRFPKHDEIFAILDGRS